MSTSQFSALSSHLSSLSDSNKQTLTLINRLAKLNFQPGSTPLDGEGDVRTELSEEIHSGLKQQEEAFEVLRQEVDDLTAAPGLGRRGFVGDSGSERERERTRLSVLCTKVGEDLRDARSQFRKAQLTAKRASEAAKLRERELLFSSIQSGRSTPDPSNACNLRKKELSGDDLLVERSGDVTTALRRLHQSMRVELERSQFAQETLDESTRALKELGEQYTGLDDLLKNSGTLLRTLIGSQKSDTWYLETALYILVATAIWLIFRRLLYGPLWWFVWLPTKLSFKSFRWFLSLPLKLLSIPLSLLGLGGSSNAATTYGLASSIPLSSTLKTHPTASNKPIARPIMSGQNVPEIRVGGGGKGAPYQNQQQDEDPSPEGSVSQQVGQMAEEYQKKSEEGQEPKKVVVRGDGVVLPDRGADEPANPKKRTMEEPPVKMRAKRDEL